MDLRLADGMCHSWKEVLTRRERLLELGGLLSVVNDEGVEEARASDLKLGLGLAVLDVPLDTSSSGVLAARNLEEVLDVGNLLGLLKVQGKGCKCGFVGQKLAHIDLDLTTVATMTATAESIIQHLVVFPEVPPCFLSMSCISSSSWGVAHFWYHDRPTSVHAPRSLHQDAFEMTKGMTMT